MAFLWMFERQIDDIEALNLPVYLSRNDLSGADVIM